MLGKSRTKGARGKGGDERIIVGQELLFHDHFIQKVMHPPSFSCRCQGVDRVSTPNAKLRSLHGGAAAWVGISKEGFFINVERASLGSFQ